MRIVTSGSHGVNGSGGSHGIYPGGNAGRGHDGTDANHAGDIHVVFSGLENHCTVNGSHSGSIQYGPDSELYTEAIGGNGGHGGRGGDGATGYTGSRGSDATRYSSGTNGGSGGPGGNGGNGGHGGDGGHGGEVRISAADVDMDLFMLCNRCNVNGGNKGIGGQGGCGGSGGPGGQGGSSYSWSETTYHRNSQGNQQSSTTYHSNSGGCQGPSGSPGYSGKKGNDAKTGRNGTFKEVVRYDTGSSVEYDWRYVARVLSHRLQDCTTDDGIFEPGEHCKLWYAVQNTGPMPTPKVQRLFCSFFATEWLLKPTTSFVSRQLITTGQQADLNVPIEFDIKYFLEPAPNVVFKVVSYMKWSVHVERVRKWFTETELGPGHNVTIQFPVRCSPTHGPATITLDEEAPIVDCCYNLCNKALGKAQGRVQRIRLELVKDDVHMVPLLDPNFCTMVDTAGTPLSHWEDAVETHPARTNRFESMLFRFGHAAKEYTRAVVGVQLFLGDVHDFMRERRIQRMSVEIQLAAYYAAKKDSKMLVVTNHETSYDAFTAWKGVGPRLRQDPNFWNATLHDGLTMEQKVNGSCLQNDFQNGGVVVVENNNPKFLSALRTERNKDNEFVFDTLSGREVSHALRDRNIGFAVLGRHVDYRWKLLPAGLDCVVIPSEDNLVTNHLKMTDAHWCERMRRCPISEDVNFQVMHDSFAKHLSNNQAWQAVYGYTCTRFGEPVEIIRPNNLARPFPDRLRDFFAFYSPFISPECIIQILQTCQHPDAIMAELAALFGPEPEDSNRYRTVEEVFLVGGTRIMQKARESMAKAGESLFDEITQRRPQWKFVVVYEIAAHFSCTPPTAASVCGVTLTYISKEQRTSLKTFMVGRLSVVRTGNRNMSNIQGYNLGDGKILPQTIVSLPMIYTVLKAMPPRQKMEYLARPEYVAEHGDNYEAIRAAIVSDIIEEQCSLRREVWSGQIVDERLLEHAPVLCAFIAQVLGLVESGTMTETLQKLIMDIGSFLHYLIGRWTCWHDHIMVNRRWRALSNVSNDALSKVLDHLDKSKSWKQATTTKFTSLFKKKTVDQLVATATKGHSGERSSSNTELLYRVMDADALQQIRRDEKPPQVVVNRWKMDSERDRRLILHKLRVDFGPEGEVVARTTRDKQHQRLEFLNCKGNHELKECRDIKSPCQVCDEEMKFSPSQKGLAGYCCGPCQWRVCLTCWERGNKANWNPQIDETQENV